MCQVDIEKIGDDKMLQMIDQISCEYEGVKGALIPVLQKTQETFGYLPEAAIKRVARNLNKSFSEVAGVVGFYSYFSIVPKGKYEVRVCLGTACYVRGAQDVLDALRTALNIEVGETTEDRMFSLSAGRCFGACGLAPVIMVNDEVYQRVKPNKVGDILDQYRKQEEVVKANLP